LPFRENAAHLADMLEAIDHIESFLDGVTFESYQTDLKTKSAVERQLQVVTEAAIRVSAITPGESRRDRTGRVSAGWEISSGMHTTGLTTKSSGIPSRMSFHPCARSS
jgi:hypothetical protein